MKDIHPNHIYCCDCLDGFALIDDNEIDLIVTSPPYKEEDGFTLPLIEAVAKECKRVLKPGGLCFVNFGHLSDDKERPFIVAHAFGKREGGAGFEWVENIVWVKNHYTPIHGDKHVNNLFEFIFLFAKGKDYHLDRLAVGVPYRDKSNIGRYSDVDLRCGGNVWYIPYETITDKSQKKHPYRFPVELPMRCIKLAGLKSGSIVLDPFVGGGTTAVAAQRLGMQYLGFDNNLQCVTNALHWLEEDRRYEQYR